MANVMEFRTCPFWPTGDLLTGYPKTPYCVSQHLRNLYAGQEATVRTGHGTTDWFQIGKGVCQGSILSPCLFDLYAGHIMKIPMDRGAWWATVHGVAKSRTQLND